MSQNDNKSPIMYKNLSNSDKNYKNSSSKKVFILDSAARVGYFDPTYGFQCELIGCFVYEKGVHMDSEAVINVIRHHDITGIESHLVCGRSILAAMLHGYGEARYKQLVDESLTSTQWGEV